MVGEPEHGPTVGDGDSAPRSGKELFDATRRFAEESTIRSWWHVGSTGLLLAAATGLAATASGPLRLGASIVAGLLLVRAFILYHDFMHRSLLRRSPLAKVGFHLLGLLLLAPPRYWRESHNFHHGNVGKPLRPETGFSLLVTSDLGSFPLMSTETWRTATGWQRLRYRTTRHALTLLCAYVTVFLYSLCLGPLFRNPRKYWDGALSLALHSALVASLWVFFGFAVALWSVLVPFAIASASGAYLFFAQHNYEGMRVLKPEDWTYYRGATESSSYMKLGPVLHWFSGNIGYHHIHHLNPLIPFYRLPEALAAIPELRTARAISLRPYDVLACLRLHLWDPKRGELVSYRDARKAV